MRRIDAERPDIFAGLDAGPAQLARKGTTMADNDGMSGLWDDESKARPTNPYGPETAAESATDESGGESGDDAEFSGDEEQVYEIAADIAEIRSSAILRVDAGDASIASSVVGVMQVHSDVELSAAAAGAILAGGDVAVSRGGAQAIIAGGDISIEQGGGSTFVAGGDISVHQGGGALFVANRIDAKRAFVGVMVAKEANVSEDSRVIMNQRSAMWFGAALGGVLALAFGLFLGIGRRSGGGDDCC